MQIVTDDYPEDTSWTLTDTCGGTNEVVLTGGPYSLPNEVYSANYCAYPGIEYQFTVYVSYFSLGDVFVRSCVKMNCNSNCTPFILGYMVGWALL